MHRIQLVLHIAILLLWEVGSLRMKLCPIGIQFLSCKTQSWTGLWGQEYGDSMVQLVFSCPLKQVLSEH